MNTEQSPPTTPPNRWTLPMVACHSAARRWPRPPSLRAPSGASWPPGRSWPAGVCRQRVAELLHTSRRSIGRMVEADVTAALVDVDVVDQARTYVADTAIRGSTAEEREAAAAWLVHAVRDEQHVARFHQRTPSRRPTASARATTTVKRNNAGSPMKRPAVTPVTRSATRPGPPPEMFAPDSVDALTRQQQRIVHRSALLAYVITAENRSGHALTLGDALLELLADITEAARMIGTILQQVGSDGPAPQYTARSQRSVAPGQRRLERLMAT